MSQPKEEKDPSKPIVSLPSFSKDLWHAFEPIVERLDRGNRALDEFLVFARERIYTEQQYARSLEKVCKKPCGQSEAGETLKIALDAIRGDLTNEHAQRVEYANNLILEIYDPGLTMKSLYSKMNRKFVRDGRKAIKDFKSAQTKFKKIRLRHEKITGDLAQAKESLLGAQSAPNNSNSKEIIKLASRVNTATKADIDSKERFETAKREIQQEYQRYFDTLSSILAGMQSNEEARINYMRGALRKLVIFDTSLLANRQYDTNGMAAIMENVNQIEDLSRFITETLKKFPHPSPAPPPTRRPFARNKPTLSHRRYHSEPPVVSRERRGSMDSNASDSSTESDASVGSLSSTSSTPQIRIAPLPEPAASKDAESNPQRTPQQTSPQEPTTVTVATSPAYPSSSSFPQPFMRSRIASAPNGRRSPSLPTRSRGFPNGVLNDHISESHEVNHKTPKTLFPSEKTRKSQSQVPKDRPQLHLDEDKEASLIHQKEVKRKKKKTTTTTPEEDEQLQQGDDDVCVVGTAGGVAGNSKLEDANNHSAVLPRMELENHEKQIEKEKRKIQTLEKRKKRQQTILSGLIDVVSPKKPDPALFE